MFILVSRYYPTPLLAQLIKYNSAISTCDSFNQLMIVQSNIIDCLYLLVVTYILSNDVRI